MIGRLAMVLKLRRGPFLAMLAAVILGVAALHAFGQDKIDDKPPIPPENTKKSLDAAKFRIDKEKAIFTGLKDPKTGVLRGGIEDNRPLASEKQNSDEYQSLTELMLHAAQFSGADLAEVGRRDLTPDDLTYSARFQFRLDLVRFEGKLVKARRLRPTKSLEDTGFKQIFEAWLVPEDESPGYPLCLLFSQWPEGVAAPPEIAEGEPAGASAPIDKWVAFGGYSFKLMTYPGPEADPKTPTGPGWLKAPLLVGRSFVPLPEPAPKIPLDRNLRVFGEIRDKTRMAQSIEFWEELTAWNRVLMHARRFTAEQLEAAATRNVGFGDLFQDHRKDYRLDLVLVEGRLVRLNKGKSPERLIEAGLDSWYEAWIIPDREPGGHPMCFVLADVPPGLEPKKSMDVPVRAAGYSFKLWRYESAEQDSADPKKNVEKYAPLLIGRSVTVKPAPITATEWWEEGFVPAVVGLVILLGGAGLTLGWWYRRGDRAARAEMDAARNKNPF
ncbi:MAG: hypothetical protein U0791_24420 [Gemmataceae bacterium]